MGTHRSLSPGEAALARTGTPAVTGVTVHGRLDTGALARAMELMCSWHPVLTCRITGTVGGPSLVTTPRRRPPLRESAGDDPWPVDAPFALDEPLMRATVVHRPDDTHLLAFALHHAVSDGMSALTALSRLWQTYTALLAGVRPAPPPTRAELPRAVDELLARRHPRHDIDAWLARQEAASAGQPAPARLPARGTPPGTGPPHGAHLHTTELTSAQAVRLYRTAREAGTTPAALVCALIMLAARARLGPDAGPLPLALGVTVDLRSRTAPPVPRHHIMQAASLVPVTAPVAAGDAPAAIARTVAGQLASALADAWPERQVMAAGRLLAGPAPLPFTAMVSNLAACPVRLDPPPGTAVTGLFAYAPPPGPVPTVFVTRTRRCLGFHLATPRAWFDAAQAAGLARSLADQLARVLDEPGEAVGISHSISG
ncbi:phthiocerol/phthiodiolone dimycocerosyl transferase family protein [Streptantibioticus cattleyicolor]|uniref:phthiocerol/phthiodiolone dimycocerosyl transferase family protein n=1 Tax=Streptantibioticus cattleyicolor TaxID=29303 RepID=UPI000213DDD5|nr:condensation domain-containing protein [Streptantibioticus cattleyicolor]CCB71118.1 conserved protein of unknown function [Streptantibioticus cattleyicolor NRRL 8057 = DSM 46488]